ncbi:hypothetical protein JN531_012140 [Flagellatimonas centrodinii]|uniref:hypothetical protein n=1 Tax=Flagellatimonas centrodinii TaxID=2806210 RepID=UPI001FF8935A|nr:hypothetical protein [Flagellatimonas centrodinii]ULQ45850.1 hypothetical protein JN531_012140 [Flagellatimonas centrodinii]
MDNDEAYKAKYKALFRLHYNTRLLTLHCAYWRWVGYICRALTAVGATAAMASLTLTGSTASAALAVLVWVAWLAEMTFSPFEKAAKGQWELAPFVKLQDRADGMTEGELRCAIDEASATDPVTPISALRDVAWLQAGEELGSPGAQLNLSRFQRLLRAVL